MLWRHVSVNLILYGPCIILQYICKPTRYTRFYDWVYSQHLAARHFSDLNGPSSGAFTSCMLRVWYVVFCVLLDTSKRYAVAGWTESSSCNRIMYLKWLLSPQGVGLSALNSLANDTTRCLYFSLKIKKKAYLPNTGFHLAGIRVRLNTNVRT